MHFRTLTVELYKVRLFFWKTSLVLTKAAYFLIKNTVKKVILRNIITVYCFLFEYIVKCHQMSFIPVGKAESASLLQSSVSHNPSEMCQTMIHFFQDSG